MLRDTGTDWEIAELELDEPKANEVLIRWVAAGLCHSDEHLRHGDIVPRFPIVGGHEGAGIIEKVGPGVSRVAEGDHVVTSFLPVCGHCRFCATGHSNI
jgi:S-(hydroxymethyl)glutathione dehydrogenase/alcohol dehydrogenase